MTEFNDFHNFFDDIICDMNYPNICNDVSFSNGTELEESITNQPVSLTDPNTGNGQYHIIDDEKFSDFLNSIQFDNVQFDNDQFDLNGSNSSPLNLFDLEFEGDFQNQSSPSLAATNVTDEQLSLSGDGCSTSELTRIMPDLLDTFFPKSILYSISIVDVQQDQTAILDDEIPFNSSMVNQNMTVTNFSIVQANGCKNEIMYQVYPDIFQMSGAMIVTQQPKANNRLRFECDGIRFLPDSRYHPMTIQFPNLQSIVLAPNQKMGIVMTIVTDTNNPHHQTFVHANDISYRVNGAETVGYGCVFVPLDDVDIKTCEKKFPRLSILYKKCDDYTFDLTPFDKFTMFGQTQKYLGKNGKNTNVAAKAKDFKKEYNLLSYKIVFQLALKGDKVIYISHITGETEVVDELKISTQPSKRKASICTKSYPEEEEEEVEEEISTDILVSKPSKKFKPSIQGLPVTHISNNGIGLNETA